MPEQRWGPLRRRWVIVAPERGKRPSDFRAAPAAKGDPTNCPFCPGNEHLTPPEIARYPEAGGPWAVRVVPNKFPALEGGSAPDLRREGMYRWASGLGVHEVVIDSPDHDLDLDRLSLEQVVLVVDMYLARMRALSLDTRFRYVQLFKNHGKEGGASLAHPHTQIVATSILPPEVEARLEAARDYHAHSGRCLVCDILERELSLGERVVWDGEGFVILCPYDSRFPFELLVLPKRHRADFTSLPPGEHGPFARALTRALGGLSSLLGDVPYNFVIHTAPVGGDWPWLFEGYHWHLEVIPRLTRLAGFEWGSGMFINPMPPEAAARHLREVTEGG